jgi:hypothetical protein
MASKLFITETRDLVGTSTGAPYALLYQYFVCLMCDVAGLNWREEHFITSRNHWLSGLYPSSGILIIESGRIEHSPCTSIMSMFSLTYRFKFFFSLPFNYLTSRRNSTTGGCEDNCQMTCLPDSKFNCLICSLVFKVWFVSLIPTSYNRYSVYQLQRSATEHSFAYKSHTHKPQRAQCLSVTEERYLALFYM